MEATVDLIIFYALAAFILSMSVLAVTSKKILRAATYLLFVLIGTAGLYLMLNYHFLAAVQISVYAGGILVLFIFAIFLTTGTGDLIEPHAKRKIVLGILASLAGAAVVLFAIFKYKFFFMNTNTSMLGDQEINMKAIGQALIGTEKYQYLLPFEILGVLLLVCIIGGILIARKR